MAQATGTIGPIEPEGGWNKFLYWYGNLLNSAGGGVNELASLARRGGHAAAVPNLINMMGAGLQDSGNALRDWGLGFAPIRSTPEGGYTYPRVDRQQLVDSVNGLIPLYQVAKAMPGAVKHAAIDFANASVKGAAYMTPPSKLRLYRAADDDLVTDTASFSASRDAAREYLDNPGFGGRNLYKTDVEIDPERFLDLSDMDPDDAIKVLMDRTGKTHPGAIGPDEWVPRISYDLRDKGIDWVRVKESFPVESDTYIWVGGNDPDLIPIGKQK